MSTQTTQQKPIYECVKPSDGSWNNRYGNARITPAIPDKSFEPFVLNVSIRPDPSSGNPTPVIEVDKSARVSLERPQTLIEIEAIRREHEQKHPYRRDYGWISPYRRD